MGYLFICLSCGYKEEATLPTGRPCPKCGRVRLVAYAGLTEPNKKRFDKKFKGIKPTVLQQD